MACGSCTMCCKLVGVEELAKPANTWCGHCNKGRGCGIYESRPPSCAEFACAWLLDRIEGRNTLPESLRPDRSHIVFMQKEGFDHLVLAHVDPVYPDSWREGPAQSLIVALAERGLNVVIRTKGRHFIVDQGGIWLAEVIGTIEALADSEKLRKVRRVGRIGKAA